MSSLLNAAGNNAPQTPLSALMAITHPHGLTVTPAIFWIAEICRNICDFVLLDDKPDKRTCRALAQTCKAVQEPVLDVLWYESENFKGLINYFPKGAVYEEASSATVDQDNNRSYRKAIRDILRRIRVVKLDSGVDMNVLGQVTDEVIRSGASVMPRLKKFTLYADHVPLDDSLPVMVSRLLGPLHLGIKDLRLLYENDCDAPSKVFPGQIEVSQWTALISFRCRYMLSTNTLKELGTIRTLRRLYFASSSAQLSALANEGGPLFHALEELDMDVKGTGSPSDWVALRDFLKGRTAHSRFLRDVLVHTFDMVPEPLYLGEIAEVLSGLTRLVTLRLTVDHPTVGAPIVTLPGVHFADIRTLCSLRHLQSLCIEGFDIFVSSEDVSVLSSESCWPRMKDFYIPPRYPDFVRSICGGPNTCPVKLSVQDVYAMVRSWTDLVRLGVDFHTRDCPLSLPADWVPQMQISVLPMERHYCGELDRESVMDLLYSAFPCARIASDDPDLD